MPNNVKLLSNILFLLIVTQHSALKCQGFELISSRNASEIITKINGNILFHNFGNLFYTEGSADRTFKIRNIGYENFHLKIFDSITKKEKLFFSGYNISDDETIKSRNATKLFVTEGTNQSTLEIGTINDHFIVWNNHIYFFDSGFSICRISDDYRSVIRLTEKLIYRKHRTDIGFLGKTQTHLFFSGNTPEYGIELWSFDGNELKLLKDIHKGPADAHPVLWGEPINNRFFFGAYDGGSSVYITDGTPEGTINSGFPRWTDSCGWTDFPGYANFKVGDQLVFFTRSCSGMTLWKSNGTLSGTERVFQFKDHFPVNAFDMTGVDLGNQFIFPAWTDETGFELWSMDKNNYQCNIIQDIHKTPGMGSNPVILHKQNNKVYFRATDSAHGRELWVTDGSTQGTKLVADMAPGTQSGRPDHIKAYGDYLSFYAFWPFDRDLWVINSSTDSLYTFEEIKNFGNRPEYDVLHRNNSILLIQGYDLEGNLVLWKSDWSKQNMKLLDNQCDFKPMHYIRSINYSDDVIYFTDTQNNLFKYIKGINCHPKARMEDFALRPNPTSGSMQIIFTGELPEYAKVDIFDLSGRKISANKSENYMNIGWDLDLNNLKSGIYIARITLENQSHSLRFLKL